MTRPSLTFGTVLAAAALTCAVRPATGVVIGFDEAADMQKFTHTFAATSDAPSGDDYVRTEGIGIGGTAGLNRMDNNGPTAPKPPGYTGNMSNDATLLYTNESFDTSVHKLMFGTYFQYGFSGNVTATNAGPTTMQLGLGSDSTTRFNGSIAPAFLTARVTRSGTVANGFILQTQTKAGGTSTSTTTTDVTTTAAGVATAGNWYYFTVDLSRSETTAGSFNVSAALYNASADGTLGTLLGEITPRLVANASLYADSSAFVGLRGFAEHGLDAIDNLSITTTEVPEPATVTGVAVLAGVTLLRRRRS